MRTTYTTKWGSDTYSVTADWSEASCSVSGTAGRQVADFRHSPVRAMRSILEDAAAAEGLDIASEKTREMVDGALDDMVAELPA